MKKKVVDLNDFYYFIVVVATFETQNSQIPSHGEMTKTIL